MKRLLIIWYSDTGGSRSLAHAAAEGATETGSAEILLQHAATAQSGQLLDADGYLFIFPENLAAISGVMKAFFDRSYYPCLGKIEGRPYATIICAGSDGTMAAKQAERIATGWRLKKVANALIICTNATTQTAILGLKTISPADLQKAYDTGAHIAAGISLGIF